jgi:hypothetical protein
MLFYRIFSYILVILNAFLFSLLFWRDQAFYVYSILAVSLLISFCGTYLLVGNKIKNKLEIFLDSFFSSLLILSSIFLFILLESVVVKIILAAACLILYFIYLNELFTQYFKKIIPQIDKLWLFRRLAQLLIVFNVSAAFFGMIFFLDFSRAIFSLLFFVFAYILGWYNDYRRWSLGIKVWAFKLILALLLTEFFVVLSFLPLVYYLRGFLMAIIFFFINETAAWFFNKEGRTNVIATYLAVSVFLIVAALATAIWY